jgi:hypothetical protein
VALIYGVEAREVNQAIKNNPDKFSVGYIVETDKFKKIKNYPGTSKAFTSCLIPLFLLYSKKKLQNGRQS